MRMNIQLQGSRDDLENQDFHLKFQTVYEIWGVMCDNFG